MNKEEQTKLVDEVLNYLVKVEDLKQRRRVLSQAYRQLQELIKSENTTKEKTE